MSLLSHWTWMHTIILMLACIALTVLLYLAFGTIIVLFLVIPPIVHVMVGRRGR